MLNKEELKELDIFEKRYLKDFFTTEYIVYPIPDEDIEELLNNLEPIPLTKDFEKRLKKTIQKAIKKRRILQGMETVSNDNTRPCVP